MIQPRPNTEVQRHANELVDKDSEVGTTEGDGSGYDRGVDAKDRCRPMADLVSTRNQD